MFQSNASLMGEGDDAGWITNSVVVHAVATSPGGPYSAADIAIGPRGRVSRQRNCTYRGGIPGRVCPVVVADDYWDAVTAHTPTPHSLSQLYIQVTTTVVQTGTTSTKSLRVRPLSGESSYFKHPPLW